MDAICPGSPRDVSSPVDEDSATRAGGQSNDMAAQLEKRPIIQILFADLDDIHAPRKSGVDGVDKRSACQSPAISDVVEERTSIGKRSSWTRV